MNRNHFHDSRFTTHDHLKKHANQLIFTFDLHTFKLINTFFVYQKTYNKKKGFNTQ